MGAIIKESQQRNRKFKVGNWSLQPVYFTDLAFADDTVLITRTEQNLQHNIHVWEDTMRRKNIIISPTKTKTIIISRQATQNSNWQ